MLREYWEETRIKNKYWENSWQSEQSGKFERVTDEVVKWNFEQTDIDAYIVSALFTFTVRALLTKIELNSNNILGPIIIRLGKFQYHPCGHGKTEHNCVGEICSLHVVLVMVMGRAVSVRHRMRVVFVHSRTTTRTVQLYAIFLKTVTVGTHAYNDWFSFHLHRWIDQINCICYQ